MMTKLIRICILPLFFFSFQCDENEFVSEENYEAVVMSRSEFENSTTILPPKPIINSGKIYIKDNFLFVGENNEGFHIFNNSIPSAPVNIAFLNVLGGSDISVKNNVFYLNNATDLIAVIPNFENNTIEITKRIPNAFPQLESPDNSYYNPQPNEVIINWNLIQ